MKIVNLKSLIKKNMKSIIFLFALMLFCPVHYSQDKIENVSKTLKIDRLVTHVFEKTQFEGVKFIKIKRKNYVICSVILPYESSSDMSLVAQLTAERNILAFLQGDQISSNTVIELNETSEGIISMENKSSNVVYTRNIISKINRNTSGFISGVQCLSVKDDTINKRKIYLYYNKAK
jgi:hypothetical protein